MRVTRVAAVRCWTSGRPRPGQGVGGEGRRGDDGAGRDGEAQHPAGEPGQVAPGVRREREEEGRNADGQGVDDRQVAGQERVGQQRDADGDGQERRPDRLGDEQVGDAFDVGRDPAAFGDDAGQGGEPAVEQHQVGDRPGRRRARAHGDADVGELEGQHVVDAVAGHRHRVAAGLQGRDHRLFLLGGHPAEDRALLQQAAERAGVLGQVPRIGRPGRRGAFRPGPRRR